MVRRARRGPSSSSFSPFGARLYHHVNVNSMAARILPKTSDDVPDADAGALQRIEELLITQSQTISALQEEVQSLRAGQDSLIAAMRSDHASSAMPLAQQAAPAAPRLKSTKSGLTTGDTFLSAALKRAFPMYVIPVKTLISPSFQMFRPHEELRDAGALVEWQQGMAPVLFVSHTWLRHTHPDSEARDKFKTLTDVLKHILLGDVQAKPYFTVQLVYGRAAKEFNVGASQLQRDLTDGFVFFDYMSIPQAREAADAQQRAIASLVSYVSDSRYFFVLAGGWTHESGIRRDELAWSERGWCRMEMVANMLSPSTKPMVVVQSVTSIKAYPPGGHIFRDWLHHAIVGRGKFTVDDDRLKLAPHLMQHISARKAQALAEGDLIFFRVLHSRTAKLLDGTGIAVPAETYHNWMTTMRFESVNDGSRTGLTPLVFAVVAGRCDIAEALLVRGANLFARIKVNIPKFSIGRGISIFGAACLMTDDPILVQLLMRHGADPAGPVDVKFKDTPMHYAMLNENCRVIKLLADHDRSLLDGRNADNDLALATACLFGKTETLRFIREHYPDVLIRLAQEPAMSIGVGLLGGAIANGGGDLELIKMLIDAGEDIEKTGKPYGKMRMFMRFADFARHFANLKHKGPIITIAYGSRAPPIVAASRAGNIGAIKLLLEHGANLHNVGHNPRRFTALHMAASYGHVDVVTLLLAAGARTDIKDSAGRTPADVAKIVGNSEIRQILIGAAEEAKSTQLHTKAAEAPSAGNAVTVEDLTN